MKALYAGQEWELNNVCQFWESVENRDIVIPSTTMNARLGSGLATLAQEKPIIYVLKAELEFKPGVYWPDGEKFENYLRSVHGRSLDGKKVKYTVTYEIEDKTQ